MVEGERKNQKDLPFNSGEIKVINNWPWWITNVDHYSLKLPIFSIGHQDREGNEVGIASFVVMHQERKFLSHVGNLLAKAIAENVDKSHRILLLTSETKGSSLEPYISLNLEKIIGNRLHQRKIVFRKGCEKVYMGRPVLLGSRKITPTSVTYNSITSQEPQTLRLSPDDTELIFKEMARKTVPVYVDDFIGSGGTIVGVHRLFAKLGLKSPEIAVVNGSDGLLYEQTFIKENLKIQLLPQPLPLRLPTFRRKIGEQTWRIAEE